MERHLHRRCRRRRPSRLFSKQRKMAVHLHIWPLAAGQQSIVASKFCPPVCCSVVGRSVPISAGYWRLLPLLHLHLHACISECTWFSTFACRGFLNIRVCVHRDQYRCIIASHYTLNGGNICPWNKPTGCDNGEANSKPRF